jgi:hypothetical protein
VIRTGWQYLPALDPAPVTITRAMQRGAGPSVSGSALTNAYTEPSQAQVRSYKWHATMVCEHVDRRVEPGDRTQPAATAPRASVSESRNFRH